MAVGKPPCSYPCLNGSEEAAGTLVLDDPPLPLNFARVRTGPLTSLKCRHKVFNTADGGQDANHDTPLVRAFVMGSNRAAPEDFLRGRRTSLRGRRKRRRLRSLNEDRGVVERRAEREPRSQGVYKHRDICRLSCSSSRTSLLTPPLDFFLQQIAGAR